MPSTMHLGRLRLRYLLAIGIPASAACHEGISPSGSGASSSANAMASSSGSASSSESEVAKRAPEFESKNVAPLPYGGPDCPRTFSRCAPGFVDAGYPAPFPECSPEYSGEYTGQYYARSRLSIQETTKARRKDPTTCCYRVEQPCNYNMPVVGRVLREDHAPTVAPTCESAGWGGAFDGFPQVDIRPRALSLVASSAAPSAASRAAPLAAPSGLRERLARHWIDEAAAEHASIAAFSVIALQLLSLAAPAALVAATHEAARDEVEHARLCFSIASAHAGVDVGPGALRMSSSLASSASLASLAIDALIDGCIGETVAALIAREAAARAVDQTVVQVLTRIADDEERHAELAFRTVFWALSCDCGLADSLRRALDMVALIGARDAPGPLEAFGVLSEETRAVVRDRAIAYVVRPCIEAMLAAARPTAAIAEIRTT